MITVTQTTLEERCFGDEASYKCFVFFEPNKKPSVRILHAAMALSDASLRYLRDVPLEDSQSWLADSLSPGEPMRCRPEMTVHPLLGHERQLDGTFVDCMVENVSSQSCTKCGTLSAPVARGREFLSYSNPHQRTLGG